MPRKDLKIKDPGNCVRSGERNPLKTTKLKRDRFNGAVDFETNLKNAGEASSKAAKKISVNTTYRITDGKYAGELCKVAEYKADSTFCKIELLTVWMKPTGNFDLIPVKYVGVAIDVKKEY